MTNGDKKFLSSFLDNDGKNPSPPKEQTPSNGQNGSPMSLYCNELLSRIKASLSAMQAFAHLSKENFKDQEMGDQFFKIVNEDIEKTISLINCFDDYLTFSTPTVKKDTINTLVEEVIEKHEREFEERKIKIIKKQLEKDLPEAWFPEEQLRYLLNSVIKCLLLSIRPEGSIGFLTRLFDPETLSGEEKNQLQKDRRYLEILAVSASDGEASPEKESELSQGMSTRPGQGEAIQLILKLMKEIITKNRGIMRYKAYNDKPMTFISLILPVERRNVVHYPSPEERLSKTKGTEK